MAFGEAVTVLLPDQTLFPGMFAVAGMGELFVSTVRAPLTGMALVGDDPKLRPDRIATGALPHRRDHGRNARGEADRHPVSRTDATFV